MFPHEGGPAWRHALVRPADNALAISATALCYLFVFPALVVLRRKYPYAPRPCRWLMVLLGVVFWAVAARTGGVV